MRQSLRGLFTGRLETAVPPLVMVFWLLKFKTPDLSCLGPAMVFAGRGCHYIYSFFLGLYPKRSHSNKNCLFIHNGMSLYPTMGIKGDVDALYSL